MGTAGAIRCICTQGSDPLDYDYNGACAVSARSLVRASPLDTAKRRRSGSTSQGAREVHWLSSALVLRPYSRSHGEYDGE